MSSAVLPDDIQSRLVIREFLVQAGIGVGIMLVLHIVRAQTIAELGYALVRVFSFYSVIDCLRALIRREAVCGPSLNRWDQAAGYSCCALFFNVLLEWPL